MPGRIVVSISSFVLLLLALQAGPVRLADVHYGKFAGRVVARLITPAGADLGRELLAAGLAQPYQGGRRQAWCS
ncbi:MAG: hypothetical protein QF546_12130 [Alphaproteobacteria bacterium]|jgi:endonuclease YncB( thermonuclease family)|nr:hypothetical protein [Alphaproteobacteria bacterium]